MNRSDMLLMLGVCALSFGAGAMPARGQTCTFGEPAALSCSEARLIPGTPGQHVVYVDTSNSIVDLFDFGCAWVSHPAFFRFTPTVDSTVTVTTCHPNTTYDTVLAVSQLAPMTACFLGGVQSMGCNIDDNRPECSNGCGGGGSTVSFSALAGTEYLISLGAYEDNWPPDWNGCPLCLGLIVTIEPTCGDPPTNFICSVARELPGTPGTHEVRIDATDALSNPETWSADCTSAPVGHNVWFTFTPTTDALATFTTCKPGTGYDTVVRALTGDCGSLFQVTLACNDDVNATECVTSCSPSPRGSTISFPVTAGQRYFVEVGAYDDNSEGCELCLDASLTIDPCAVAEPPIVHIQEDFGLGNFGCACDPTGIFGWVMNPTPYAEIDRYRVEYRPLAEDAWTLIEEGTGSVPNLRVTWDTSSLPEGWYMLRLRAQDVCGRTASTERILEVDKTFADLAIEQPPDGAVVGGHVCVEGRAWDNCFSAYALSWEPVGGGTGQRLTDEPCCWTPVRHGLLGTWDTIGQGVPDGDYVVEALASSGCVSNSANFTRRQITVTVDNTPPVAIIDLPTACDAVTGNVPIRGTANDAHLDHWVLQY
ncbi:MAG: fibronectin type III domain-containing protein, partial [Planctomycetota bacterium]